MAGGWGSKHNGIRIGAFWDGLEYNADKSKARITDPRVAIDRDVNIVDEVNNLSWSGGAVVNGSDANINVSGSGEKRIRNVTGEWRDLIYGSTHTANFSANFTGINYAGATLTVTKTVTYPARPYDPPAAPTGFSATRVTNAQMTLAWTNVVSTGAPYTGIYVERWDNVSQVWTRIQTLGVVTSWTDNTTIADRQYQYRVQAVNTGGVSPYSGTDTEYTSPADPLNATAQKVGPDIRIDWTNPSMIDSGFRLERSDNGGAWVDMGVVNTADAVSHLHVGPSASATHKYRLRLVGPNGLYSGYSNETNTIQLLTNPLAPTNLQNGTANVYQSSTTAIPLSWQHNPVDTTPQTKREIEYRVSTDNVTWGAWTSLGGAVTTPLQNTTIPAGTIPNGRYVQWHVRTWGSYPDPSPYSASKAFLTSTAPTMTINSPSAGVVISANTITVTWTYTDPEVKPQLAWGISLFDNTTGAKIGSWMANNTASSYLLPVTLSNHISYRIEGWVKDSDGLSSPIVTRLFSTNFLEPMVPVLTGEWDTDRGAIVVSITNPAPTGGRPATIMNKLFHSDSPTGPWELIGGVAVNTAITDQIPVTYAANYYKVTAHSALPSSVDSAVLTVDVDPEVMSWTWFNGGPKFSVVARARANQSLDETYGRTKVTQIFDGREFGVEFTGQPRSHTFQYSADTETDYPHASGEDWRNVQDAAGPSCYRDPWNKWFVSLKPVTLRRGSEGGVIQGVSISMERIDYAG